VQLEAPGALERDLRAALEGEVRFDAVSRALYSTDASVYQIVPRGVVVAKTREDVVRTVAICARHRCPITMRGGGTSQAGQAVGEGIVVDISKHLRRIVEFNAEERWVRVEPGIVLDELNAFLRPHGLRFAPDISTASRATIGGMMANNSAGARSVLYGKTIDHVIEQTVLLSDGSIMEFRALSPEELEAACVGDSLAAECYRTVRRLAREHAEEIGRRYPKVLRRVGGYNLDEFVNPDAPFNLAKIMVGSEGTLGVVLEAKLNLVPLPQAKAVLCIQFHELLEALAATPSILTHSPSAVEVMDGFILSHTRQSAALQKLRETFIDGDPGALLCVEFYADRDEDLPPRVEALVEDLTRRGFGYRYHRAFDLPGQARVWSLREAALGLSMAMKDDAKSLSFVEDTAVAPEKLRDYIERFLALIRRHGTSAGIYAHASVGCLHVRPVVNMKTAEGVAKFEAIANDVSDLVLEFGGALSGEHGDGLVRSPFMEKMFGPALYEAFRTIKRTFDPHGIFNLGKIVDAPPLTTNLRFGAAYRTSNPPTYFDYSDYGGMGGAVEMCSGLGVCRKTMEGTMCPSFMATREETDSTRGRANVLRLALAGRLAESGLDDRGVYRALDLCLECRACKAECPVGVDVARYKSEFLAGYWKRHGTSWQARAMAKVRRAAELASVAPGLANWAASATRAALGIDRRRTLPRFAPKTFAATVPRGSASPDVLLFNDTFTNFYNPEVGHAAWRVLERAGRKVALAPNACCGRPLISKGFLDDARELARRSVERLSATAAPLVFLEPSCLSAICEDVPSLLRGKEREKAQAVAQRSRLFEDFVEQERLPLPNTSGEVLLHGHCHQKSMGLLAPAKAMLARAGARVADPDAGCCGMAGSFGYTEDHYEVSRAIAERKLMPAIRGRAPGTPVLAAGVSCRHQILDFAGERAMHPAVYLDSLL
jgi:FAD/FMN-containing dehydrogenase/Fe-S oxidoreductase